MSVLKRFGTVAAVAGLAAVGAALVFHVVFPVILEVQLPTGLLGF